MSKAIFILLIILNCSLVLNLKVKHNLPETVVILAAPPLPTIPPVPACPPIMPTCPALTPLIPEPTIITPLIDQYDVQFQEKQEPVENQGIKELGQIIQKGDSNTNKKILEIITEIETVNMKEHLKIFEQMMKMKEEIQKLKERGCQCIKQNPQPQPGQNGTTIEGSKCPMSDDIMKARDDINSMVIKFNEDTQTDFSQDCEVAKYLLDIQDTLVTVLEILENSQVYESGEQAENGICYCDEEINALQQSLDDLANVHSEILDKVQTQIN